jgi:hypothetical protein
MTVCGNKLSGVCGDCAYFNRCRNDEIAKLPKSHIEWMREATFDELAGAIYEWYTLGYTRGKSGKKLNSITEVVEWLKGVKNDRGTSGKGF